MQVAILYGWGPRGHESDAQSLLYEETIPTATDQYNTMQRNTSR